MEKNFNKEQIISLINSNDDEIKEAAFGYIIRNIVKNDAPMFQMSEVLRCKEKLSDKTVANVIIHIGRNLKEESEIQRFIQMSYWFCEQPFYISKVLEDNHNAYFEERGLDILSKLAQQTVVPEACYQYLMIKSICGDEDCKNVLLHILHQHPNVELDNMLDIAKQRNWPDTLFVLKKIVQRNHNENNLKSVLRYVDYAFNDLNYDVTELKKLFIEVVQHYDSFVTISYETFGLIISLSYKLKVDEEDFKQIAEYLICRISNENPLIREKKMDLLTKVIDKTQDYLFVLKLLTQNLPNTLLKRVILLSIYTFMEKFSKKREKQDIMLLNKYKDFVVQFIKTQGSKFDKGDFEYIRCILNLNKDDKKYIQVVTSALAKICQQTAIQVNCLLHCAVIYKQNAVNVLQFVDWNSCPLEQSVLYSLQINYKNSKKAAEKKAYLTIFEQLSQCQDLEPLINILLGEILTKLNFTSKTIQDYPAIIAKIKWYKERQQILDALNN